MTKTQRAIESLAESVRNNPTGKVVIVYASTPDLRVVGAVIALQKLYPGCTIEFKKV